VLIFDTFFWRLCRHVLEDMPDLYRGLPFRTGAGSVSRNSKAMNAPFNPAASRGVSPLLTDLYQLTMACGYWKAGMAEREAVFHLFFRKHPFSGGFSIAAGLGEVATQLAGLQYRPEELDYLRGLKGNDGKALFDGGFIDTLAGWKFACDVDAIPEGTVVFPHEPLLRVRGPLWQGQLLETMLLNTINFQTLVATKAARVCLATQGEPVLEFGMRRAQGVDGALAASRAAYIGGCAATSNVLAGHLFGIPVRGTHAHSWVMAFDDELTAFDAYANALPNNVVFLVDTYDTLQGVRHAVEAGGRLRERGFRLAGIRLDSGDLAYLSIEARKILDAAGFHDTAILATNDLDEQLIASLKMQGARIDTWGVGTRLVTAYDQPALGGVYKLSAIRPAPDAPWQRRIKLSEQTIKISNPGIQQVRRFREDGRFIADMIYDCESGEPSARLIIDPADATRRKRLSATAEAEDLLQPVFRAGKLLGQLPDVHEARQRTADQLAALPAGSQRFLNPHSYPVGLEPKMHELKNQLILQARGARETDS
jgi:nicotinate phosphoribosyltransferase